MFLLVVATLFACFVNGQAAAPSQSYFPVGNLKFPYYTSYSLNATNPSITKLVIVVHGIKRNAIDYFNIVQDIAVSTSIASTTAVVAPHFECAADKPPSNLLIYACDGWLQGYADTNTNQTYSFAVIDMLLKAGRTAFPNLTQIIVSGHSAGGQTVQRYGALTVNGTTEALGVPVKYLAMNPGTYMYLDGKRLSQSAYQSINSTCPAPGGNNCAISAADFVAPYWDASGCPDYNSGKYGTDNSTGYLASVGVNTVISQFPQRNFTYLLGDLDVLDNADLDTACEAEAEGWFRKQRGLVWEKYVYLIQNVSSTMQSFGIVPGCGHNDSCMFQSSQFIAELTSPVPSGSQSTTSSTSSSVPITTAVPTTTAAAIHSAAVTIGVENTRQIGIAGLILLLGGINRH